MLLPDYYGLLEVPNNATQTQIKRSYHRLVRLYHPDVNKQTQDTRIKQLNEAYAILSNSTKRAGYDALLAEERRAAAVLEFARRQREEAQREPKMTWVQGAFGFVRELRKALKDD